jgi:hypothetical protein
MFIWCSQQESEHQMSEMQSVNNLVPALKKWQKPYATIVRPYKGGHITHKHTEYKGALSM